MVINFDEKSLEIIDKISTNFLLLLIIMLNQPYLVLAAVIIKREGIRPVGILRCALPVCPSHLSFAGTVALHVINDGVGVGV